jgi:3-isopropylmalate/(R)-2-methylmalate dehydratase large subunit
VRVWVDGRPGFGVAAKDLVLHLIAAIGAAGDTGHVLEYAG